MQTVHVALGFCIKTCADCSVWGGGWQCGVEKIETTRWKGGSHWRKEDVKKVNRVRGRRDDIRPQKTARAELQPASSTKEQAERFYLSPYVDAA